MATSHALPPLPLTTPSERSSRFGPFPSVSAGVRFAGYAAAGALVIPWFGAIAWVPFLGVGFLVVVWEPGGVALDVRLLHGGAWWQRALHPREERLTTRGRGVVGSAVRVDPGHLVSVLKCEGRPIAFLPPDELSAKFARYRELLRSIETGVVIVGVGIPVDPRPWVPDATELESPDRAARAGYSELVGVLCRRRQRRRVYLLQWVPEATGDASDQLEARTHRLLGHLEGLGVTPVRLEGASLGAAVTRFGWNEVRVEEAGA